MKKLNLYFLEVLGMVFPWHYLRIQGICEK